MQISRVSAYNQNNNVKPCKKVSFGINMKLTGQLSHLYRNKKLSQQTMKDIRTLKQEAVKILPKKKKAYVDIVDGEFKVYPPEKALYAISLKNIDELKATEAIWFDKEKLKNALIDFSLFKTY